MTLVSTTCQLLHRIAPATCTHHASQPCKKAGLKKKAGLRKAGLKKAGLKKARLRKGGYQAKPGADKRPNVHIEARTQRGRIAGELTHGVWGPHFRSGSASRTRPASGGG